MNPFQYPNFVRLRGRKKANNGPPPCTLMKNHVLISRFAWIYNLLMSYKWWRQTGRDTCDQRRKREWVVHHKVIFLTLYKD